MKGRSLAQIVVIAAGLLVLVPPFNAQESKMALPRVATAEVPFYPPGAVHANIQGVVQLKITTDGHRVIAAVPAERSIQPLARAAEANLRTWQFDVHQPTSFTVTYRYKLVTDIDARMNNPKVILNLPTEVEVQERRWGGTVDMPGKVE